MKKIFIGISILLMALGLSSCTDETSSESSDVSEITSTSSSSEISSSSSSEEIQKNTISKESVKILAIGNSFSDNAMNYLYPIFKAFGAEEVVLGNMYIGGASIDVHASNAAADKGAYAYRKNDSRTDTAGSFVTTTGTSIKTGVSDEDWQIITLQQNSWMSGFDENYTDLIDGLGLYAKSYSTNKDVQLGWHMTWAYQSDAGHSQFYRYDNDQMKMYEAITTQVQNNIVTDDLFDFVIPAGTAVQNLRSSYFGDHITADGYHLNSNGEFVIGLAWVLQITGWDIEDLDVEKVPSQFRLYIDAFKEAAVNAVATPFSVTDSIYTEAPVEPALDLNDYEEVSLDLTVGFYNATFGSDKWNVVQTEDGVSKYYAATQIFTKETLPVGSVIVVEEGYGYRPEAWLDVNEQFTLSRPSKVNTHQIIVDDFWWGNYTARAFNVYTEPSSDLNGKLDDISANFKIYIPKA